MSASATEKLDWYQRRSGRPEDLDACPDCERPMALVLEHGGGPDAPGGGRFLYCEPCAELWLRAEGGRVPLASRHARVLAREVLRLRARLRETGAAA